MRRSPASLAVALALPLLFFGSALEAGTVVVTLDADVLTPCAVMGTGECSLRDAITFFNAHSDPAGNMIHFRIPPEGAHTIGLAGGLPVVTRKIVIDGYSQPGARPNSLEFGDDAVILISIDANDLTDNMLHIGAGGEGSAVRGLSLSSEPADSLFEPVAIRLSSCCNTVAGNFIGTDRTGTAVRSSPMIVASSDNRIGGPSPADRNVIAGDACGGFDGCVDDDSFFVLTIRGNRNRVEGNYVGANPSGTASLSFHFGGIGVSGAENRIGGPAAARNLISGNRGAGVYIDGVSERNVVTNNFIGTDSTGHNPLGNAFGIFVDGARRTRIGGAPAESRSALRPVPGAGGNTIAFNTSEGVWLASEPWNGAPLENSILSNSIFSNGALGIDLGRRLAYAASGDGPTPNDPADSDSGPNAQQNYPELTRAILVSDRGPTQVAGTLESTPNRRFRIQFFASRECDPSGFGEGQEFVGEITVLTDVRGRASFETTAAYPAPFARGFTGRPVPEGRFVTATATDPEGNTSEFSRCRAVRGWRVRQEPGPFHRRSPAPVPTRIR